MFGRKQYYGLVAGLRELTLEGTGVGGRSPEPGAWEAVREEIMENLAPSDRRAVELFYRWDEIAAIEDPEEKRERFEEYYAECARSRSGFLREWSRFDRNLRNAIAAHTARGKGWEAVPVGEDKEGAAAEYATEEYGDAGEYKAALPAALEKSDVVEKERAIDLIRWDKADELSEFDFFGMPTVFAYLVKAGIIHRWIALDPAVGRQMYERLVDEMEAEVKIKNV